jgi:hypothetical protein
MFLQREVVLSLVLDICRGSVEEVDDMLVKIRAHLHFEFRPRKFTIRDVGI